MSDAVPKLTVKNLGADGDITFPAGWFDRDPIERADLCRDWIFWLEVARKQSLDVAAGPRLEVVEGPK